MKLWLDDVRPCPDSSWQWAKTAEEAIALLSTGLVEIASLDHDLGHQPAGGNPSDPEEIPIEDYYIARSAGVDKDGIAVVNWMIENETFPTKITIHSWNPIGAENMRRALARANVECAIEPFQLPVDRDSLHAV